jgi:predicted dehydrogenase
LTIAYIGNGRSANRYHLPYVLARPDTFRVKSIYGGGPSSFAAVEGVRYLADINEMWSDDEIDLVVVCSPSHLHASYAREALKNGKNALIEKPFAETSDEARELFDFAAERNLFLQCYQNRRFDSDFLTVQKVLARGVLGDLLEVEMHFDYFRPEVPRELFPTFNLDYSYLYGHGVHTVDQVLSWLGSPDRVHYDVRQLLGPGRMNDYFDLDMYYGAAKVSVKSSYFRIKPRPSFVVYGTNGMFAKEAKDRQEEHLKMFYLPGNPDFGIDQPSHYGTLTYFDDQGGYHEEKVVSEVGDYGRIYDGAYASIVDGAPKVVGDHETIELIEILEAGIRPLLAGQTGR